MGNALGVMRLNILRSQRKFDVPETEKRGPLYSRISAYSTQKSTARALKKLYEQRKLTLPPFLITPSGLSFKNDLYIISSTS
jgi:hypothetical protein